MTHTRRSFLKKGGMLATGLTLAGGVTAADWLPLDVNAKRLKRFGLQLYTIRDEMAKDAKNAIRQAASFGYKQLEGYEGPQGIFWGMKNTEFEQFLDDLDTKMIATHCDINKDFEQKAAQAGEIGMKYLVCPWIGPQKTLDDYKKFADQFNACGEICRKHGLRFAYHNHGYTFEPLEGQMPQDVLMQHTDPELVDHEMDIYWVVTPGADPVAWLEKYPDRFRLCHVKDRKRGAPASEHDASVDLGTGSIDWPKVLRAAAKNGMKYYIVEQEDYPETSLKSAAADAAYIKSLRF